jgi:D-arabinose 1-dehydrogenase-like Zn-dependent alcohol dehydrogenase
MGLLNDVYADDAALAFTDTDVFAESVTYTKRSGATRTIKVVVDREPMEDQNGHVVHAIYVTLANSTTLGVALSELNTGGDRLTLAPRIGQDTETLDLFPKNLISQDAGMLRFRLK